MQKPKKSNNTGIGKIRLVFLAMILCTLVVGGFQSLTHTAQAKAHTHKFRWVTKVTATCKNSGCRYYECSCGYVQKTEVIPKTAHSYNRSSATCTQDKHCTVCGYVAQPAKGHSYTWQTTRQATCTQTGIRQYKCSCGNVKETQTIQKTAHQGTHWVTVVEATCTKNGRREFQCDCGHAMYGEEFPGGHQWKLQSVVDSTCAGDGYRLYVCTRSGCRETRTESIPRKTEHTWVFDHQVNPTCIANGTKYYRCSNPKCSATRSETINRVNHSYRWVVISNPTDGKAGVESYRCEYCENETNTRYRYLLTFVSPDSTGVPGSQVKTEGDSFVIPGTVPVKTGYTFLRWGTSPDASTGYAPGAVIAAHGNMTLYAVWKYDRESVTSRDDGVWFFPANTADPGLFPLTDWAGCSSSGCPFHPGVKHYSPGCHSGSIGHNGIDIHAGTGEPVYAASYGKIVYCESTGSRGLTVVMEHPIGDTGTSYYSVYQHLSQCTLEVGKWYNAGQEIAEAGATGGAYQAHLHFSILIGESGGVTKESMSYISTLESKGWVTSYNDPSHAYGMIVTNPKYGNCSEEGAYKHCGSVDYTTNVNLVTNWISY